MEKKQTLFEFPCFFPIKIMTEKSFDLEPFVIETLKKHVKDPSSIDTIVRESSGGKYISVTAKFEATDKKQLDKLYKIFTKHKDIKMVL